MNLRLAILSIFVVMAGHAQRQPPNRPVRLPSRGTRGAVAAGTEYATEAGMRMYFAGGNAVDAGIATMLAAPVPESSHFGLGGESPILVRTRIGDSPPSPKCEDSGTGAASMVAMPASTALPPAKYILMPASVAYSVPAATAPRVPRDGRRTGRFGGCRWACPAITTKIESIASLKFIESYCRGLKLVGGRYNRPGEGIRSGRTRGAQRRERTDAVLSR